MSSILKAKEYAIEAHSNDTYGSYPYSKHLNDVYNTLILAGITDDLILSVAWLHDTIEDTPVIYEDLFEDFGKRIADLTYLLTDKRGKTRNERQAATYPLIAENCRACVVKWADRLSNILMSQHEKQTQFFKYQKEHTFFKKTLYNTYDKEEFDTAIEFMSLLIDKVLEQGPLTEGQK